jgi:hypothetical protein
MQERSICSKVKGTFFGTPLRAGLSVSAGMMLPLLIPVCTRLIPLGNENQDATNERDQAQDQ